MYIEIELRESTMNLPTLAEIAEAQKLIYALISPTPQISWPQLDQKLEANVWIKHENHTPMAHSKHEAR
jgi:threonine dehydratase